MGQPDHPVEVAEHDASDVHEATRRTVPGIAAQRRCGRGQNGPVPRFEPFPAIRYAPGVDLDAVIAPPYDVLSDADVDALAARDTTTSSTSTCPAAAPTGTRRAADCCGSGWPTACWSPTTRRRSRSTACASPTPPGTARDLVGVLGGLEVVDEGAGGVLPHERTTPKASTDRLDLTRATTANLSPIWGLSLAAGLTALLAEPGEPVGAVTVDGVEHVVERVDRPRARRGHPRAPSAADDVLIADGHHRYGISRIYRDEVRAATGRTDTRGRGDAGLRRRARRRAAQHRGHPPPLHRRLVRRPARRAGARAFELAPADPPTPATLAAMRSIGPPRARRPGRRRVADAAAGCLRRRPAARRRLARARPRRRHAPRSPTSTGWTRSSPPSASGAAAGRGADPPGQHRRDRAHGPRGPADATEVDVLHAQAAHRLRHPRALSRASRRTDIAPRVPVAGGRSGGDSASAGRRRTPPRPPRRAWSAGTPPRRAA